MYTATLSKTLAKPEVCCCAEVVHKAGPHVYELSFVAMQSICGRPQ